MFLICHKNINHYFFTDVFTTYLDDYSVRISSAVSVSQNLHFLVGMIYECPDYEFELKDRPVIEPLE